MVCGQGAELGIASLHDEANDRRRTGALLAIVRPGSRGTTLPPAYFVPLDSVGGRHYERVTSLLHCTVARVRQHAKVGICTTRYGTMRSAGRWCSQWAAVDAGTDAGHAVVSSTRAHSAHVPGSPPEIRHPAFEQRATMVRSAIAGPEGLSDACGAVSIRRSR